MEKKYILIIVSIIALISGFVVYYIFFRTINITDLDVKRSPNSIEFNDKQIIENNVGYDYYQVYIYPSKYTLECLNNESVCNEIIKNKDEISKKILNMRGKDLKQKDITNIKLDLDILNKENNKQLLKDIVLNIYNKKQVTDKEDTKTTMQKICEQGVIDSIPAGTSDYDLIIKQGIDEKCFGTDKIKDSDVFLSQFKDKEDEIKLKIDIKELSVVYKFFKKENNNYIEKEKQEKYVKNNIILEGKLKLNEL